MNDNVSLPIVLCDWGTSSFRLSLYDRNRGVLAEFSSGCGVASIAQQHASPQQRSGAFKEVLQSAVKELIDFSSGSNSSLDTLPTKILCSGMISSSIGWKELPYSPLPFSIDGSSAICELADTLNFEESQSEMEVWLVSGICAADDVMRGEEVQAVGILSCSQYQSLQNECLLILPGTHSKHILVRNQKIISFQSYMTGELYTLLATHSVLQHSVEPLESAEPLAEDTESWFRRGVQESQTQALSGVLFRVRALSLLSGLTKPQATAYLSGLLIGSELASLDPQHQTIPLLLAAGEATEQRYALALTELGLEHIQVRAEVVAEATRLGQLSLYNSSLTMSL